MAILGQETVRRMFPEGIDPIGQSIRIEGITFRVEGILNVVGGAGFGPNDDDLIVAPITTVQNRLAGERELSGKRPVSNILVQARDNQSVEAVAEQIRETLREEHRISFRDEDDFQIFTQDDLLASLGNITGLLTVFLAVIAGISLAGGRDWNHEYHAGHGNGAHTRDWLAKGGGGAEGRIFYFNFWSRRWCWR